MKAILFLAGGLLAVFVFILYVKKFIATPQNILFFTLETEYTLNQALTKLTKNLEEKGLKVVMVDKGTRRVRLMTCDTKNIRDLLNKAPFFTLMLPCEVLIYTDGGKTKISTLKEPIFIRYYTDELSEPELRTIIEELHRLRIAIGEVVR